jgi:hypothetical protein
VILSMCALFRRFIFQSPHDPGVLLWFKDAPISPTIIDKENIFNFARLDPLNSIVERFNTSGDSTNKFTYKVHENDGGVHTYKGNFHTKYSTEVLGFNSELGGTFISEDAAQKHVSLIDLSRLKLRVEHLSLSCKFFPYTSSFLITGCSTLWLE